MDTGPLEEIGLTRQQAEIYLALLRKGPSTASTIAAETGIDRATTYRFLDGLIQRGFVSYVITNNIKYFSAAHPEKLVLDLHEKEAHLKQILPELISSMHLPKEEATTVELFKGKEGVKTVLKDILKEGKPYTYIGEVEKYYETLGPYAEAWLRQVERLRIKGRLVLTEGSKFTLAKTERCRLISKDYISKIATWTYGNKTALFIWATPLHAVVINNKDVTESNLNLFNYLWKLSKPYKE